MIKFLVQVNHVYMSNSKAVGIDSMKIENLQLTAQQRIKSTGDI